MAETDRDAVVSYTVTYKTRRIARVLRVGKTLAELLAAESPPPENVDHAVWSNGRVVAILRGKPGGMMEVIPVAPVS